MYNANIMPYKIEKMAIANVLQLEAVWRRVSRSWLFWPNLYCACAQTAISQLPIKILTLPLDSATPISYMAGIIWQRWWTLNMWRCPLTLWPWSCVTCCASHWYYFHQVWTRSTHLLPFTADTLRHAVTLTFASLTLNVWAVSAVTWWNFLPNLSEFEQSAAVAAI